MQCQDLIGTAPARKAEELREVTDLLPCSQRSGRLPEDIDGAVARPDQPAGDLGQGRLAGPVGAKQPEQLAFAELEVQRGERLDSAVSLADPRALSALNA